MKINENKIKKFTLLAAILAPMIYLFGSLFAALQGSHGEQVFAEPVYVDEWVEVDNIGVGEYKFVFDSEKINDFRDNFVKTNTSVVVYRGNFIFNGTSYTSISNTYYDSIHYFFVASPQVFLMQGANNNINISSSLPWSFISSSSEIINFFFDVLPYGTLYKLESVPSSSVIESPSAYSDYIFKNFFVKNNFLAASGENVINGTPDYGFAPAAEMIRYIDSNMLHLANVEWGALVIGYVYYAFHVTIVFLMFELLMFFPHMIENIYEKFERGL